MSVSATLNLPDQPAVGNVVFQPLGGNGTTAPLGSYLAEIGVVGDASGGNATVVLNGDPRYTNMFGWVNLVIAVDAAASEFVASILRDINSLEPPPRIVGTLPHVATTTSGVNAGLLWYPPAMLFDKNGTALFVTANVAVTETYSIRAQIFCFNDNVERLAAFQWLAMTTPGTGTPSLT